MRQRQGSWGGWPTAVLIVLVALHILAPVPAPGRELWPQDRSDLKSDPGIRFGVLANGMRYAIKPNANPAGTASLRLRIAAGSLHENDAEQGAAHFLEHMAFNGSKNFPEGEMFRALQRLGLAIGANANATTDFDATTFSMSLPSVRAETLDVGFNVLREIAGRLTLSAEAIERERGVILSEERARDTPAMRSHRAYVRLLLAGQRYPDRFPIGQLSFIRSAGPVELRGFYERYYRPERAVLVVAGAIDPGAIEAKIAVVFSDWSQPGPGPAADNFGRVKPRKLEVGHFAQGGVDDTVTISWVSPEDLRPDTRARRRETHHRIVAFTVLNRRLSKLARQSDPPFIDARVQREVVSETASVTTLVVRVRGGDWARALSAAEQELRRAVQHGLHQSEVEREALEQQSPYKLVAANENTRTNADVADWLMNSLEANRVPTSAGTDLDLYTQSITGLKAVEVTRALKEQFAGAGPIVWVAGGRPVAGGNDAIAAAFRASGGVAVAALPEKPIKQFTYRDFGAPGRIVDRQIAADLGATFVRFANGVKLNVKSTNFERDKVSVVARFAGGHLALPKTRRGIAWALPFAFVEGGLGQLEIQELEQTEPGHFAGIFLDVDEDAFRLSGETVQRDVLLQLQVLAAYFVDPAYRPDGLRRLQAAGEGQFHEQMSTASGVLSRELPSLVRDGDARWAPASIEDIRALTMADIRAAIAPSIARAPVEVTIVGSVGVQEAIKATAKTFGALPPRAPSFAYPNGARDVRFPGTGKVVELRHGGRADQAAVAAAWPGPGFFADVRRERAIAILSEIIQLRLIDEVREAQGGTYVPFVSYAASKAIPNYGYIVAGVEPKPEAAELFFSTLDKVVTELREGELSQDLLERARKPVLYQNYAAESTNAYWVTALTDIQSDPRNLAAVRSAINDYGTITREEVVAAALAFLDDRRRLDVRVLPK